VGHAIHWDNADQTVVLQAYTEGASKDDLYQLASKSADLLKTVDHTVHLIIDERNVNLALNAADIAYLERLKPKNQGMVVIVVPPSKLPYKQAVQDLGKRLGPKAFAQAYFAESIEEARQFLQEAFEVRYSSSLGEDHEP